MSSISGVPMIFGMMAEKIKKIRNIMNVNYIVAISNVQN